ncbi:MAG: type II toxin-antitoxin system mRNA interferase toxin, RelE/StbE family [Candidatus Sungbacteria bacterium]|nr:type II toxin-antitoxin system mRNA interferase toxin, RelE/StbE family [Candidatus Sungbacteria bacterium]
MKIILHRNFKKQYIKLRDEERQRFGERRDLFLKNPFHPILNNHPLHGAYRGYRSISVGGDLRVIYEEIDSYTVYFILIDTHSNLYE